MYFESQFLKLEDVIGFSDNFGCNIPSEELISFLCSTDFSNTNNFIKIRKKGFAEISTQTDTFENYAEISTQTETINSNKENDETTVSVLKRSNAVLGPLLKVSSEVCSF